MELIISDDGDVSVGMNGAILTMEFNFSFSNNEEREEFRRDAIDFFESKCSSGGTIRNNFSDECNECGSRLVNGKCTYKGCITRVWEEQEAENKAGVMEVGVQEDPGELDQEEHSESERQEAREFRESWTEAMD